MLIRTSREGQLSVDAIHQHLAAGLDGDDLCGGRGETLSSLPAYPSIHTCRGYFTPLFQVAEGVGLSSARRMKQPYRMRSSEGKGDRLQAGLTVAQSTLHQVSLDLEDVSVAVLNTQQHTHAWVILHLDDTHKLHLTSPRFPFRYVIVVCEFVLFV